MSAERVVNGRVYPLWNQFVDGKQKWIGGLLEDHDMGLYAKTLITDIDLVPNGSDSAYFRVQGKDFTCGFDVHYGGVVAGEVPWITFSGYAGHRWRIKEASRPGVPQ